MKNQQLLAYALIALGVVALLSRLGDADWLWLALIAAAFLAGYSARRSYGFLVAGSVLMGAAVGSIWDTQSGTLLSLAVGFLLIDRIEPRPNRWPLYVAGVLGLLGGLSALSQVGQLGSVAFALLLIGAGAYLLRLERRQEGAPDAPPPTVTPSTVTAAPTAPPVPTVPYTPAATPAPVSPAPPTVRTVSVAAETSAEPAAEPEPELTPEEGARYERLEAWRKATASADGVPAYIVLRNETLALLARHNPQTLDALGAVKGIGPVKLERYGAAILAALRGP